MTHLPRPTRGYGLLERQLADRRHAMALRLLQSRAPDSVLDVGCGAYPRFLERVSARRRVGLDQAADPNTAPAFFAVQGIEIIRQDLRQNALLPFPDDSFDAATMLAVIEHIPNDAAVPLLRELRRVLVPDGIVVVTTPASWTGGILWTMAKLGLVSREEIEEHTCAYSRQSLTATLAAAGFPPPTVRAGSFELGMNLWATALKKA